jgi:acyl-coenzyme A synthetase/AMP-(fatty) acid ligase
MGYLNNPKATAETFDSEGWLHTGDQGFIDDEGMLTITDRLKEMIKVKGIGVAPAELEDLLLGHPKVEDVAVMGVKDDYSGELPKAYVVPKAGVEGDKQLEAELKQYVKERKVRHKHVDGGIDFVPVIPKSASGKILRRVLRDQSNKASKDTTVKHDVKEKAKL